MTVFLTPVWSRMMSSALLVLSLGVSTALAEESTGKSFVENFDVMDPSFWYVSNGWNNGAHQNCTWSKKLVRFDNGQLELGFRDGRAGDRNYSCGEIQTKGRYRYGTYEARIKAATAPVSTRLSSPISVPSTRNRMMKSTWKFWEKTCPKSS